jgi:hypothetical protein
MKSLEKIVHSIISSVTGGQSNDEPTVSYEKVKSKVNEARGSILKQKFLQSKTIHPDWIQEIYPEYDEFRQDNLCVVKFKCPGFIDLGTRDGFIYAGSADFPSSFNRVSNIADLANARQHPIFFRGDRVVALYQNGVLEIWSKRRIDPKVVGVMSVPSYVPGFSEEQDPYPADIESIGMIEELVVKSLLGADMRTPDDNVSDSSSPGLKQNRK